MNGFGVKNDHLLEIMFSLLRWLFLVTGAAVFYRYYAGASDNNAIFYILLAFSFLYMAASQLALHNIPSHSRLYLYFTRSAILFDIAAFTTLLTLTGGTRSPFLPIAYLIILHASVYWRMRGGILAALALDAAYTFVGLTADAHPFADRMYEHFIAYLFVTMTGLFGGVIVARERQHFNDRLLFENLAKVDYLTGLKNHRTLQEQLKLLTEGRKEFVLALGDIDFFKTINDSFGHVVGDHVLKEIGALMTFRFAEPGTAAFRYGGEEFAVIFCDRETQEAVMRLAAFNDELKDTVACPQTGHRLEVTMSFGVVRYAGEEPAELLQKADELLYAAKEQGRNRVLAKDKNKHAG